MRNREIAGRALGSIVVTVVSGVALVWGLVRMEEAGKGHLEQVVWTWTILILWVLIMSGLSDD